MSRRNRKRCLIAAAALLAGGCSLRYGSAPATERLSELRQNESTKGNVLQTLGPPRGYGMVRLPEQEPRTIWLYEFASSEFSGQFNVKMLLVFFDGERYAGNLWFRGSGKQESLP